MFDNNPLTMAPVAAGKLNSESPEFLRHQQVFQMFGIRRGTLYNLAGKGLIKSVSLRRKGTKFGCRLFYVPSIRAYLHSLLPS